MSTEDIKIGSKEEKAWSDIVERIEKELESDGRAMEINQVLLEFAKKREAEEKEKFK